MRKGLLDVQLFVVLAHSSSFCRQGVEHHCGVDEVLLHALEPRVQLLEPHQLSGIWGERQGKQSYTLVEKIHNPDSACPPEAFHSCEINLAENYINGKKKKKKKLERCLYNRWCGVASLTSPAMPGSRYRRELSAPICLQCKGILHNNSLKMK